MDLGKVADLQKTSNAVRIVSVRHLKECNIARSSHRNPDVVALCSPAVEHRDDISGCVGRKVIFFLGGGNIHPFITSMPYSSLSSSLLSVRISM